MDFGNRLRNVIQELEITFTQFAKQIGVPQPSVSQWVAGLRQPRFANLAAMYEHFGINPGYLITGQGPMFIKKKSRVSPQEAEKLRKAQKPSERPFQEGERLQSLPEDQETCSKTP